MTEDKRILTEVEKEVIRIIEERNQKGYDSYGKGLDFNDDYDWLDMAIEKVLGLASKFEKDCLCIPRERVGSELKKVLVKYKYPV